MPKGWARSALSAQQKARPDSDWPELKRDALALALLEVMADREEPSTRTPDEYFDALTKATIKSAESDLEKSVRRKGPENQEVRSKLERILVEKQSMSTRFAMEAELRLKVEALLAHESLSEADVRILRLVDLEGLSHDQAAGLLEISPGTARTRHSRARKKLKRIV